MKIVFKVIETPNTVKEITVDLVDYISVGRRSLSYRLKGQQKWLFCLRYDSNSHIRILEDDGEKEL